MEEVIALPVILDVISRGGALTVTGLVIWVLLTERVVPRGRLKAAEEERDRERADCEQEKARMAASFDADRDRLSQQVASLIADRDRLRERLEGRHRRMW